MKNHLLQNTTTRLTNPGSSNPTIGHKGEMQKLISHLIAKTQPNAVKKNSFVVNDVTPTHLFQSPPKTLLLVLGNLLLDIIDHTENNCIRIRTSPAGCGFLIHLTSKSVAGNKDFVICMATLQLIAERMGEKVRITYNTLSREPNIEVSFSRQNIAA